MILRKTICSAAAAVLLLCTGGEMTQAAEATSIRMAHLRINAADVSAFTAAVKEEMEASLRVESGVLAIYAVAAKDDPTRWTFFEMYADEHAYEQHKKTAHFQKYFQITKGMITERVLVDAVPMELRDKHNTPSVR